MTTSAAPKPDRKMLSTLAKALWKHRQKMAEPGLSPAVLTARWKALRSAKDAAAFKQAKQQARTLLRAITKAGYALEPAPPRADGAKAKAPKDKPARDKTPKDKTPKDKGK